jgi:hypothetical protein
MGGSEFFVLTSEFWLDRCEIAVEYEELINHKQGIKKRVVKNLLSLLW